MTKRQIIDAYFIEHRTKILDIAAFLDRLDRASDPGPERDFRMRAFREALHLLCSDQPGRIHKVQMLFSDPTTIPMETLDRKSAMGAYDHWKREE
jgi:hypothetical protein